MGTRVSKIVVKDPRKDVVHDHKAARFIEEYDTFVSAMKRRGPDPWRWHIGSLTRNFDHMLAKYKYKCTK